MSRLISGGAGGPWHWKERRASKSSSPHLVAPSNHPQSQLCSNVILNGRQSDLSSSEDGIPFTAISKKASREKVLTKRGSQLHPLTRIPQPLVFCFIRARNNMSCKPSKANVL